MYLSFTEALEAGAGPKVVNKATLQEGAIWVKDLEEKLMRIPTDEQKLKNTPFKKQNCIPNKGT